MKRAIVLCLLLAAGGISIAAAEFQQAPAALQTEKVKDNLYMIRGAGGNTAVFITDKGVVLVDTKNPGNGQAILDQVRKVTDKPVTLLINTHTHPDHTGSNEFFGATVDSVVHENTKTNMTKMKEFAGDKAQFLPKRTYKDTMSIGQGKDQIDLYYFGPGHTNGDTFVVFRALRTVHAGDMFAGKNTPFVDANNGGSAVNYGRTLAKAASTLKDIDSVITGHSTVMTHADLKEYADFNNDFITWVEGQIKAGKTVDAAAMEYAIPEKYKGYTITQFGGGIRNNIQTAYNELGKK